MTKNRAKIIGAFAGIVLFFRFFQLTVDADPPATEQQRPEPLPISWANKSIYLVPPGDTDPGIVDGDGDNVVFFAEHGGAPSKLLIFIGAIIKNEVSKRADFDLKTAFVQSSLGEYLNTAVEQGYRVISLDYKYNPPGTAICPEQRGDCYERFRAKKIFGTGEMPEVNITPAETILNRLTKLLIYLAQHRPQEGWGAYVENGQPKWPMLAVTGHSQGAGHAAFLAKKFPFYRVMLNSSPWDHYENPFEVADWLKAPGATPPDRWYGLFDAKDSEAFAMRATYPALGLAADHYRILDLEPQSRKGAFGHFEVLSSHYTPLTPDHQHYAYQPDWIWELGRGD